MKLPAKSRYSAQEAAEYISNAAQQAVRVDEVLDWGAQGLFKLYIPMASAHIRCGESVSVIRGQLVEIRPSPHEAAVIAKGARIGISKCWRDGLEVEFVRSRLPEHGGGFTVETLRIGLASVIIAGAELDSFIASIAAPTSADTQNAASRIDTEESPPDLGSWQDAARAIANECYENDTKNKCRDGVGGYARRVMQEMKTREIKGPRGFISNPLTIQREALGGEKWWAGKKK